MSEQRLIPPAAANPPPRGSWPRTSVVNLSGSTDDCASRLLTSTSVRPGLWVGLATLFQVGMVGPLKRACHPAATHCREITVSEPWKWSFPDSERAFLPSPSPCAELGFPNGLATLFQLRRLVLFDGLSPLHR